GTHPRPNWPTHGMLQGKLVCVSSAARSVSIAANREPTVTSHDHIPCPRATLIGGCKPIHVACVTFSVGTKLYVSHRRVPSVGTHGGGGPPSTSASPPFTFSPPPSRSLEDVR